MAGYARQQGRKPKPSTIVAGLRDRDAASRGGEKPHIPPAPSHLTRVAQAEWRRIGRKLSEAGLLGTLDLTALAMYCDAYGRWLEARSILQGPVGYCSNCNPKRRPQENETPCVAPRHIAHPYGLLTRTRVGAIVPSAYLKIANEAMDQMRRLLVEFGMTPASRARIPVEAPSGHRKVAPYWDGAPQQPQDPRITLQQALQVVKEHVDRPDTKTRKTRVRKKPAPQVVSDGG